MTTSSNAPSSRSGRRAAAGRYRPSVGDADLRHSRSLQPHRSLVAVTDTPDVEEAGALSGDTLPLEARFEQGVVAMLAVRVAEDYGKTPGPVLLRDAEDGKRALDGAFFAVPQQKFDAGLIYTGQDTTEILLGQTNGDYAAWQASTAYLVRETVTNLGLIYECVTAGTSASSGGPTGTNSEITDGTLTWCFRRVDGS